jgi:hypothetical protein
MVVPPYEKSRFAGSLPTSLYDSVDSGSIGLPKSTNARFEEYTNKVLSEMWIHLVEFGEHVSRVPLCIQETSELVEETTNHALLYAMDSFERGATHLKPLDREQPLERLLCSAALEHQGGLLSSSENQGTQTVKQNAANFDEVFEAVEGNLCPQPASYIPDGSLLSREGGVIDQCFEAVESHVCKGGNKRIAQAQPEALQPSFLDGFPGPEPICEGREQNEASAQNANEALPKASDSSCHAGTLEEFVTAAVKSTTACKGGNRLSCNVQPQDIKPTFMSRFPAPKSRGSFRQDEIEEIALTSVSPQSLKPNQLKSYPGSKTSGFFKRKGVIESKKQVLPHETFEKIEGVKDNREESKVGKHSNEKLSAIIVDESSGAVNEVVANGTFELVSPPCSTGSNPELSKPGNAPDDDLISISSRSKKEDMKDDRIDPQGSFSSYGNKKDKSKVPAAKVEEGPPEAAMQGTKKGRPPGIFGYFKKKDKTIKYDIGGKSISEAWEKKFMQLEEKRLQDDKGVSGAVDATESVSKTKKQVREMLVVEVGDEMTSHVTPVSSHLHRVEPSTMQEQTSQHVAPDAVSPASKTNVTEKRDPPEAPASSISERADEASVKESRSVVSRKSDTKAKHEAHPAGRSRQGDDAASCTSKKSQKASQKSETHAGHEAHLLNRPLQSNDAASCTSKRSQKSCLKEGKHRLVAAEEASQKSAVKTAKQGNGAGSTTSIRSAQPSLKNRNPVTRAEEKGKLPDSRLQGIDAGSTTSKRSTHSSPREQNSVRQAEENRNPPDTRLQGLRAGSTTSRRSVQSSFKDRSSRSRKTVDPGPATSNEKRAKSSLGISDIRVEEPSAGGGGGSYKMKNPYKNPYDNDMISGLSVNSDDYSVYSNHDDRSVHSGAKSNVFLLPEGQDKYQSVPFETDRTLRRDVSLFDVGSVSTSSLQSASTRESSRSKRSSKSKHSDAVHSPIKSIRSIKSLQSVQKSSGDSVVSITSRRSLASFVSARSKGSQALLRTAPSSESRGSLKFGLSSVPTEE